MSSSSPRPATVADYCDAVRRFSDAIDRVLEQGRALERRYELFCAQHALRAGEGTDRLTAPELDPVQRHTHQRLLELSERAYALLLPTASGGAAPATPVSTAFRALGSRNRI